MSSALVSATGLAAIRGERVLFKDISITVDAGQAWLLRGANGAGKTTLLRILAGLTQAETGSIERNTSVHWCAHRLGLKPNETPRLHLANWTRAWGSSAELVDVLGRMGLRRPADVPARYLSAGQRQRTALARLLLEHRPLWLMDEPFSALDVKGRAMLLDLVARHRAQGGAVIAAIHGEADFAATGEVDL
ncbi:MAG: heme ABC exporter ATP-binding protein CcmA [Pseudomonadota bacterium]